MTPLDAALWWISKGVAVFPLIPKSKAPAVSKGFLAASLSEAQVREWWTKKPTCGVGLAVPEGIIVTDFDAMAHEHLCDNVDTVLPPTLCINTPGKGKGKHFWWRLPLGVKIPPKVSVMDGLDIRTFGSYAISPPSSHPDVEECYTWDDEGILETFTLDTLPVCPQWIIEACIKDDKNGGKDKPKVSLVEMAKGVSAGGRQVALFRAASHMRARGFEKDEAVLFLDVIIKASEGSGYGKYPNAKKIVDRVWSRYEATRERDHSKLITLDELMSMDLGDVNWFVEDLLGPGLALVYADEKVGKSMAVANLALSLATREKVWGRYTVPKSRGVLYLDLEQSPLFGQQRWRKILDGRTAPQNLRVRFQWPRMGDGGIELIKDALNMNRDIEVVVVDIWSLFKPTAPPPGQNAYDMDNHLFAELKRTASQYGVLFILIHHHNKSGEYSGSRGTGGSMDYMFQISREDGSVNGLIKVKGKNIPSRNLTMSVDIEKLQWKVTGVA